MYIPNPRLVVSVAVRFLTSLQGVYANAAVQLGKIMDSTAFKVWSTALTLMLVIIWLVNHLFTIKGLITGRILGLEHGWRAHRYPGSYNV